MLCGVAGGIHTLLLHPHTWVRLFSARLFGLLFAAYSPEDIIQSIVMGEEGGEQKVIGKLKGRKRKAMASTSLSSEQYILENAIVKVLLSKSIFFLLWSGHFEKWRH